METEIFGTTYEKNSLIFEEGQPGEEMYIIQSGAVEISRRTGDGVEVIAILEKGELFGEMSLISAAPRTATAKAIHSSRLLPISQKSLLERGRKDPSVFLHMLRIMIANLRAADVVYRNVANRIITASQVEDEEGPQEATSAPGVVPDQPTDMPADEGMDWDPASLVSFKPGEVIFSEGTPGEEMYIVIKGSVRFYQGEGEERRELSVVTPGEIFGEMAIISEAPRSATAIADSATTLAMVKRDELQDLIKTRPEIALYLTKNIIRRIRAKREVIEHPAEHLAAARQIWRPLLKKDKVKVAFVSLSTCAGCSAVLLDDQLLAEVFKHVEVVYCPILMDKESIPEVDVAIVDGLVRLKDDVEVLAETRAKSRYLVAWGTCATYGGIPMGANRFEPEELLAETYGHATDAFAYYLSGQAGVDPESSYQKHENVALLRQASRLSAFERVDFSIPGCPPNPELLLNLVMELKSQPPAKLKPIVCAECRRKPAKDEVSALGISPIAGADPGKCLTSLGVACMGFVTKGGCGAPCTSNGLPCWGCRGPSSQVVKKITEGGYYEELFAKGLSQRCKMDEALSRERIRVLRRQGHALYDFDQETSGTMQRCR